MWFCNYVPKTSLRSSVRPHRHLVWFCNYVPKTSLRSSVRPHRLILSAVGQIFPLTCIRGCHTSSCHVKKASALYWSAAAVYCTSSFLCFLFPPSVPVFLILSLSSVSAFFPGPVRSQHPQREESLAGPSFSQMRVVHYGLAYVHARLVWFQLYHNY